MGLLEATAGNCARSAIRLAARDGRGSRSPSPSTKPAVPCRLRRRPFAFEPDPPHHAVAPGVEDADASIDRGAVAGWSHFRRESRFSASLAFGLSNSRALDPRLASPQKTSPSDPVSRPPPSLDPTAQPGDPNSKPAPWRTHTRDCRFALRRPADHGRRRSPADLRRTAGSEPTAACETPRSLLALAEQKREHQHRPELFSKLLFRNLGDAQAAKAQRRVFLERRSCGVFAWRSSGAPIEVRVVGSGSLAGNEFLDRVVEPPLDLLALLSQFAGFLGVASHVVAPQANLPPQAHNARESDRKYGGRRQNILYNISMVFCLAFCRSRFPRASFNSRKRTAAIGSYFAGGPSMPRR